jgi:acetyl-CoA C-acetyltransferase
MPHVDQAAALVVTSLQVARDRGIPEDQIVHVWGGAGADDTTDPLARAEFGTSAAMAAALEACLDRAGTSVEDVDLIDVYSCFPVVPKLAGMALGLPRGALLSVAGGHSSFGGPLNSYALHAIATLVDRLRAKPGTGLVHGNGGYLTYHHTVLLGSAPHPDGYVGSPDVTWTPPVGPDLVVPAEAEGPMTVETATVEHDRTGQPGQAFVVGRTSAGVRVAAASAPGDTATAAALSLASLPPGRLSHVGREVLVTGSAVRLG